MSLALQFRFKSWKVIVSGMPSARTLTSVVAVTMRFAKKAFIVNRLMKGYCEFEDSQVLGSSNFGSENCH